MRPAERVMVRNLEGSGLAVGGGRRFHERDDAVLVPEIQMTVGGDDGRRALAGAALARPHELAGRKLDADRKALAAAVSAVEVTADEHHAAVMTLELAGIEKVALCCRDPPVGGRRELEHDRSGLVARR